MGAMRAKVVAIGFSVLALVAVACGGSGDGSPGTAPSATTAPEVRAYLSLCSMRADVTAEDVTGAEATFQDDAHDALHELAARVEPTDRATAAAVLEATSKVEADLGEASPELARLGTDVDRLIGAMRDALDAAAVPAPSCPEPSP
jgi:hypothetical protein